MTASVQRGLTFINRYGLAIILALSVLVRLAAALVLGNQVVDLPGTSDQLSYHNLALRVIDGHGFTFGVDWWPLTKANTPTAHWSYLYTFYLIVSYKLFGANPIVPRVIQAILVGLLQPSLAYLLGKAIFERRAGLVAAALTAGYAYFIYYAGALMTEPFYITAILGAMYLAMRYSQAVMSDTATPRNLGLKWAALLGLTLGAVILLRQLFMLIVPFIFLWLWFIGGKKELGRRFWGLALAGLIIIGMIVPFTAYNYNRFHRLVLLNTNSGYAFFWGNHPIYGTHFIPILTPEIAGGSYINLIPADLQNAGLDEAALDQELLKLGMGFVTADPGRYVLLSLSRIPAYFMFWPSADSGLVSNVARVASFGIMWPFMLYGVICFIGQRRQTWLEKLRSPASLMLLVSLLYTGMHLLTWALVRYRLPVDAMLLIFAGLALVDLWDRLVAWRTKSI
jgi:4-amino-4-deoxy-L-arabinose transferase-like glycosyltransferase